MTNQNRIAMTLRLSADMADQLSDVSETLRMSKAAWVRRAIRRSLEHARVHEVPLLRQRGVQEALAR
jgi:predicted DNA-binding protein